jgi:GAF domain-containing protein
VILIDCAGALARSDGLEPTLRLMLDAIGGAFDVGSAAVVVPGAAADSCEIVASLGLDAGAAAGLTAAMRQPGHPVVRTFSDPVATYDVTPMNPGGPALRSHLPLVVRRDGIDRVVGVLALAYDRPIDPDGRPTLEAVADLAAVAIERHGRG